MSWMLFIETRIKLNINSSRHVESQTLKNTVIVLGPFEILTWESQDLSELQLGVPEQPWEALCVYVCFILSFLYLHLGNIQSPDKIQANDNQLNVSRLASFCVLELQKTKYSV